MTFGKTVWPIVWKDLIAELRTKDVLLSMCFFAFLVLIIFNFAFAAGPVENSGLLAGMLWVACIFAGLLGLNQTFGAEKERGALQGLLLCPVDRTVIYVGKVISTSCFMAIMEVLLLGLFAVLYRIDLFDVLGALLVVMVLGTLGFVFVGVMLSAMAIHAKAREIVLTILLFPMVVPLMIAAVKATGQIFDGQSLAEVTGWLRLLLAFDLIFFVLSYGTFGFVVEE